MPLLTAEKAMALLGISDDSKRPRIQATSLAFQNWLAAELRNYFHTEDWILAATISFSGQTITDSDSGFVDAGFTDNMDVHIEGSKRNDGIYRILDVDTGTLDLDDDLHEDDFHTEAAANSIYITRMQWPVGLELPTAQAIEIDIGETRAVNEAVTSFFDLQSYPEGLRRKFEPFRKWGLTTKPTDVPSRFPGNG